MFKPYNEFEMVIWICGVVMLMSILPTYISIPLAVAFIVVMTVKTIDAVKLHIAIQKNQTRQ